MDVLSTCAETGMNITPKDILEKDFDRKFHGYDPQQVDEFLDEIIKQFESLIEENENVVAKNEELKTEISRLRSQSTKADSLEERLMSTVLTAQRNATLYLERAEAQAAKVMDVANQNARTVLESTHLRVDALREEISRYERVVTDYKRRFQRLLEEQAAYMDAHTVDTDQLVKTAADVDHTIGSLEQQMRNLDEASEENSVRIHDILQKSREETEYDFQQSTANLQEIVNEIIDD